MSFSRRPAKFQRPDSGQDKPVTDAQLELLRASAALVKANNHKTDESSEANKPTAENENVKEASLDQDGDNNLNLLAEAAVGNEELEKGKETRKCRASRKGNSQT